VDASSYTRVPEVFSVDGPVHRSEKKPVTLQRWRINMVDSESKEVLY